MLETHTTQQCLTHQTPSCRLQLCRVIFEQLLAHWEQVNARAMALLPSAAQGGTAAAAAGGRGAGPSRKKQQELQFDSQGQPSWDTEQVSAVWVHPMVMCHCCLLMHLKCKQHIAASHVASSSHAPPLALQHSVKPYDKSPHPTCTKFVHGRLCKHASNT
jgi:hypothetical protein